MPRFLRWTTALAAVLSLSGERLCGSTPTPGVGPRDRMVLTDFMRQSSMDLRDLNGDGAVSDRDVALQVHVRLVELYGPELQVGDLDGDGHVTAEDLRFAIEQIVRGAFGKTAPGEDPVGLPDLAATVDLILAGSPLGDLNLDGHLGTSDILVTLDRIGDEEHAGRDIMTAVNDLYDYMRLFRELGREYFMADEPVASDHSKGISMTWPKGHPGWWPPNHMTSMSVDWRPQPHWSPSHYVDFSQQAPGPMPAHDRSISQRWPANHDYWTSRTWERTDHDLDLTRVGDNPLPAHWAHDSSIWPPGHWHAASSTWPRVPIGHEVATSRRGDGHHEAATSLHAHDRVISRQWWPGHVISESRLLTAPPLHHAHLTRTWSHSVQLSQVIYPPNHNGRISLVWGLQHDVSRSSRYPPSHHAVASANWPAPQPQWPANHLKAKSEEWHQPEQPGVWPVFPPDHTWFTTFSQTPGIVPRNPWAAQP